MELEGYHDRAGQGLDMRVLPEPGLTIVLVLDGELHTNRSVDPEVAFVWRGLVASGGRRRTGDLAAETG
ncbi:hypothetical protein [Actinomadura sp. 3N407]|uniref:hypothetical protein n=1 Tax=Actinomadura sp. 3N407 TaxID=3457423 RepID=UPI003FCC4CCE